MSNQPGTTTRGVRVSILSRYIEERSDPEEGLWFFAYRVELSNVGERRVQLISRHWIITDGNGRVEEVRGPGVIGEQPVLEPGQQFEYTSACPLPTPFGTMHGSYQMIDEEGERFDATITPFALSMPNLVN